MTDDFHTRMNSGRIDIEHMFGSNHNLFKRIQARHTWKLKQMKTNVNEHMFYLFFMSNVYSCFRGNKTATKYGFAKVDIGEYLNVTFADAYDGDNTDDYVISLLN